MGLLNWSEQYSVGLLSVDSEHKKLFDMVNEMHEAMRTGQGNAVLEKILGRLVTYTRSHFAAEERLMQTHGYPGLAEHKKAHDALTAQVIELQRKLKGGKTCLSIEVMLFLRNWLTTHILGTDMKYAPFLKSKGAA